MSIPNICLGIDLGTTYCAGSRAAVWEDGVIQIITDEDGNSKIPSCVSFAERVPLCQSIPKNQYHAKPQITINDITNLPFSMVTSSGEHPGQCRGGRLSLPPMIILAMILNNIKDIVERSLNRTIRSVVVSAPSYADCALQNTIKDAGKMAGLDVIRVIDREMAALLAYKLDTGVYHEIFMMTVDLGATATVMIYGVEDGIYERKATAHSANLDGDNFTTNLVNYCLDELKNIHGFETTDFVVLQRLRDACESAKRALSVDTSTVVELDDVDLHYATTVTRELFENLNLELFNDCVNLINKVVKEAGSSDEQIAKIVLVGGSSKIPKIQQMLCNKFNVEKLRTSIDPECVVAHGAAVQNWILSDPERLMRIG